MMTIFFGFYFKVYNIKIFDNHGNLMVDKPLIAYQNCNFYSWAGVNWLSVSVQNKVYHYFAFLEKTNYYYLEYDNEKYKINEDNLKNLIEQIIIEVKKNPNCDFIEFNKCCYMNRH